MISSMNAKRYSFDDISRERHYWISQALTEDELNEPTRMSCDSCGERLLMAAWLGGSNLGCTSCGSMVCRDALALQVETPEELLSEVESDGFWRQTWYHASTSPSWATDIRRATGPMEGSGGLLIHAGSHLAALNRADDLYGELRATEIYLYSFRLRGTSAVARDFILKDENYWQEWLTDPVEMAIGASRKPSIDRAHLAEDGFRAAAYYNCYEMPGELALILHSNLIQLNTVTREKLTR